jgi:hypothetical protein
MLFEGYMLELCNGTEEYMKIQSGDWSYRWVLPTCKTVRDGVIVGSLQPGTSQMHLHETEVMY